MIDLSYALRSKPFWWIKYKDPDICAKWKAEALVLHFDEGGGRFTEAEVDFVLAELAGYEKMRHDETGVQVQSSSSCTSVSPLNVLRSYDQQSCCLRVYESDTLVTPELRSKLVKGISELEDVPEDERTGTRAPTISSWTWSTPHSIAQSTIEPYPILLRWTRA